MSKREEEFRSYFSRAENGGSLHGDGFSFDSLITLTRFGEVSFALSDEGNLVANFAELGLMFYYSDEGDLIMTVLDIGEYISNLGYHEVKDMPQEGQDLLGALSFLNDEKMDALVFIHHVNKSMEINLLNENGQSAKISDYQNVNYKKGLKGDLELGKSKIVFEFLDMSEDFSVSIGEVDEKKMRLVGLEFSKKINFEEEIFGDNPKRLQILADKIISH